MHPVGEFQEKLAAVQHRAERVRAGLGQVRSTGRSDDGQITVTVDASGNVVELGLGAREKAGSELAQDILRTIRVAQAGLPDAVRAVMGEEFAGSEVLGELDRQYRTAYPAPPPAPSARRTLRFGAEDDRLDSGEGGGRAAARKVPRRRSQPDDGADYGDRNLLR